MHKSFSSLVIIISFSGDRLECSDSDDRAVYLIDLFRRVRRTSQSYAELFLSTTSPRHEEPTLFDFEIARLAKSNYRTIVLTTIFLIVATVNLAMIVIVAVTDKPTRKGYRYRLVNAHPSIYSVP